jgi:hypothetical protein
MLTALFSCETNSLKSGVNGNLQYGEGSCVFDQSFWTYSPYSGYIHFVNTATKDTFPGSINQLLDISDSTLANVGDFKLKLEPGNYYLCIRTFPILNEENLFIVQPNQTTEQNFWIYKCM